MELNLNRPLLFFDIESTGLNIPTNSIIELSFVKILPGGEQRIKTWKIKPWDYAAGCQRHIAEEASKVNGVTDDMVRDCPTFYDVADEVAEWLKDSYIAGDRSTPYIGLKAGEEYTLEYLFTATLAISINTYAAIIIIIICILKTSSPGCKRDGST